MPKASAPNAPWVAVWLSPHTMVMPGCVRPSSGPMTWTMPCLSCALMNAVEQDVELPAQFCLQLRNLLDAAMLIDDRQAAVIGRDAVIHRGKGAVGPAHCDAALAQPFEGLRRGHFMHQVQVNVQDGRAVRVLRHHMRVPDFSKSVFGRLVMRVILCQPPCAKNELYDRFSSKP